MTDADLPHESNPLRLAFCPQCDYALTGLPPAGVCPECGRAYDGEFIVLRGRPATDAGRWSGAVVRWVLTIAGCVGAAAALYLLWVHARDPFVVYLVGLLCCWALLAVMTRFSSPRPGEVLVWLSPAGLGQQAAADPKSWAGRLARAVPWLMAASGIALMVTFPASSGAAVQLVMMPLFAGLAWWGRPRPVLPGDGLRPPMYAWQSFADVSLTPSGHRHRLIGRHDNWYSRGQQTVAINLTLPPEAVAALRSRVDAYRRRST